MEVGGSLRLPDSRGGYRSAGMGPAQFSCYALTVGVR
jgi:hypothetical protein